MKFGIRSGSLLERGLNTAGSSFLNHSLSSLTRLLPHTETVNWTVTTLQGTQATNSSAAFDGNDRRSLKISIALTGAEKKWLLTGSLNRLKVPKGIGAIPRTINLEEKDIADRVAKAIQASFIQAGSLDAPILKFLEDGFDERVVAEYLSGQFGSALPLNDWFKTLRQLSEQTYENSSLSIGCFIDMSDNTEPNLDNQFPNALLEKKKYRALSDGYRTAYKVSKKGALLGLVDLSAPTPDGSKYYPLWTESLAAKSQNEGLSFCLTRQGDILVFSAGNLRFSYRFGRWQYWNHSHIVDLIRNALRGRGVNPGPALSKLVKKVYRVSLDVAFRRSGGLFVILTNKSNLNRIVRKGDGVGDSQRHKIDAAFDNAMNPLAIMKVHRSILTELTSLDGAVVISTGGAILAYAAVLEPKNRRKAHKEEGSRTKAALGSSNYGVSLKISSDGDISIYSKGKKLMKV